MLPNPHQLSAWIAERGGFEPPIPFWGIPAFQASALNHSAISPLILLFGWHTPVN